ncbi:Hemagglutinin-neuraminidase [Dissostichus eleginoides]|uniref:Hemagglutinin-neuraminidase n=1 Tax=Dissostichus eleginoides TaxID=100907 RepID=A0AAD9BNR6_DISEL|nr:Hemagglutinin-neuraminidase [Dissostichus eleginoides]
MAHFLPTGTLPAAPHVLASVRPRAPTGPAAAPGPEVGTQEDAWLDWHHFHAALSSMDVMLCNVTADFNLLHVVSGCKPYPISLWGGTMAPRDALPDARGPLSFPRSSSHTQPPLLIPPSVQSNDCPLHAPYHPILRFSSAAVASYG